MGPGGAVSEPLQPELLIPAQPDVVALSGDAVVPAGQGHVAGDLLGMPDYRQPPGCVPGYLSFGHKASFVWRPKCQRPVSVSELEVELPPGSPPIARGALYAASVEHLHSVPVGVFLGPVR